MIYDDDLGQYVYEYDGIAFVWDEEPEEDVETYVSEMAEKYYERLDDIVEFIMPDLIEMYGDMTIGVVKEKLGKTFIDTENCQILYLEHSFDPVHIFTVEYMDDFSKLLYFSVDG